MDKAKGLAALRILLGAGFLYAGLEKVFDFAGSGKAFTAAGFLKFGTNGSLPGSDPKAIVNPTHDLWVSIAGNPGLINVINSLVVIGEVAIGVALIVGIATRFASVMGALMMGFITLAAWSFAFGPVNETMLYAAVALYLAYAQAGLAYGFDAIRMARVFARVYNKGQLDALCKLRTPRGDAPALAARPHALDGPAGGGARRAPPAVGP